MGAQGVDQVVADLPVDLDQGGPAREAQIPKGGDKVRTRHVFA